MSKHQADELIHKYLQGETTPEEANLVEQWFQKELENSIHIPAKQRIEEADNRIAVNLINHINKDKKADRVINLWRYAAAAMVLLFISFGAYFIIHKKEAKKQQIAQNSINVKALDIAPGSNKATLTLADGKKIILSESQIGVLASEGSVAINKAQDGNVVYDASAKKSLTNQDDTKSNTQFNILTTPRGGQFCVTLSDSTKIWLNASSSVKYPTVFRGSERIVELSGEAYFEVAHNKLKPFKVITSQNGERQEIQVLGTHFNVNSYNDETSTKTTLIQGSVRVSSQQNLSNNTPNYIVLHPGQQSILTHTKLSTQSVDTDEAIAWKKGYFQVNEADLGSIMRQLSRWYNIDVRYEEKSPTMLFHFRVSRNLKLSEVLKILELNGVNFKIEGRTLIVKS